MNVNSSSSVSSARSYSMEDPQSSYNPFNSVNAIKTCFESTNTLSKDQQQIKSLTVDKIETPKSKEPKKDLEDEFKDLHLNLPVLEFLAHTPMYNVIFDKYVASLKLGKNGPAFIQSEMPKKMKDTGLFILPCRPGYSEPFDIDTYVHGEWEMVMDAELNPFRDVLVSRKMVKFLGSILINFKGNMKELKDMIDKKKDCKKPPKEGDGAWHSRIELIDPDGERFDRVFQSIPATRKLSEKEKPSDILDLEHFYDA
ncbi:hypothetical protein Tco_1004196 [Tanacetum coccineum]|uniref:Uncharacterized protein n=1 Tax=Tanacetum coccineum TaxID=301880 RepID=A0ABQ5FCM1_9ASTR